MHAIPTSRKGSQVNTTTIVRFENIYLKHFSRRTLPPCMHVKGVNQTFVGDQFSLVQNLDLFDKQL